MRMVSLEIEGFKRFGHRTKMNVSGRVVAIVGPNEAGKTSILSALDSLRTSAAFGDNEFSRGIEAPEAEMVAARFLIDDGDRDEIGKFPGITDLRWYIYSKEPDGSLIHRVEPANCLKRDLTKRTDLIGKLRRAAGHKLLEDMQPGEDETGPSIHLLASQTADLLERADESLTIDEIGELRSVAEQIQEIELPPGLPKYIVYLPQQLVALAEREEQQDPLSRALEVLDQRHPRPLLLGADERDLKSDYDLTEIADNPPAALRNLASLAKLDLVRLRDAQGSENYALVEKLLEDANVELKNRFEDAWKQSGVFLRLATDGSVLRIFVSAVDGYTSIAERSDGLRSFIALLAFTALNSDGRRLILLVDEAENHLHYDAQADLIRVFSKQEVAEKIIFTTHSAGCLPNDLAMVRMVEAEPDGLSRISNSYWAEGQGLTPLLIGMGASLLAFTPARRALFAEGGSDALLLPAIFRAAMRLDELNFQIVPGLAEVPPTEVPNLDLDAAAVCYLVDGDSAGRKIISKLKKAGVPHERILVLGGPESNLTSEDLVDETLYLRAVRSTLGSGQNGIPVLPSSAITTPDRSTSLKKWCQENSLSEPNKVAIAYEILELHAEGARLLNKDFEPAMKMLHSHVAELLQFDINT